MKLFKFSLTPLTAVILILLTSLSTVEAKSLAITNATVYTATKQGILTNATVIIEQGKISAVFTEQNARDKKIVTDETFDAQGKILTPGLIGAMNQLGLVEVGAVADSRDGADKKAKITFDASLAFNPLSAAIAYNRKGGITRDVVTPSGGEDVFKGQSFVVNLSGKFDSVLQANNAVVAVVGAKHKGSRALSLQTLFNTFDDATKKLAKAKKAKLKKSKTKKDDNKAIEFKRDEKIVNAILAGTKPLLVYADRATDMLALIKLKEKYKLDLVIIGAADAELITKQLVTANIPVVIDAMRDLPASFDSLHVSLKSAANLVKAGVKVALLLEDGHNLYQLRYNAGNAIANGLSKMEALAAVTANVADIFHLNAGTIAQGKAADLVLWSDDPFEISTKVEKIWIAGDEYSTQSRQDALRKRYTQKSARARGYLK